MDRRQEVIVQLGCWSGG